MTIYRSMQAGRCTIYRESTIQTINPKFYFNIWQITMSTVAYIYIYIYTTFIINQTIIIYNIMKCNNTFLFDFLDLDCYFLFYQYKSINVGSSVCVIVCLGSRFIAYMKLEHGVQCSTRHLVFTWKCRTPVVSIIWLIKIVLP